MPAKDYLGDFEQLIVLAIARLEDDAYGMRIRQEIEEKAGREATSAGGVGHRGGCRRRPQRAELHDRPHRREQPVGERIDGAEDARFARADLPPVQHGDRGSKRGASEDRA